MILTVDENPNCEMPDPRVYQERSEPVVAREVLRLRNGKEVWCQVVAWGENGVVGPALARKVDDSGEGTCYLVYGGRWGLRLQEVSHARPWNAQDSNQWGEAFLLLPPNGEDLRLDKA